MHIKCKRHYVLDKMEDIYITLSHLPLMRAPQVLEMSLPQEADILNDDFLWASDKSKFVFNLRRLYLSVILTAAIREDLESEGQPIPAMLEGFFLFQELSKLASN
jgi:hypothetical protein